MSYIITKSPDLDFKRRLDEYLKDTQILPILLKNNIFIAGGAILSTMSDVPISDIDLYFEQNDQYWTLRNFFRKNGYEAKFDSASAITYTVSDNKIIQLIKPASKSRAITEILENFDLGICKVAYSYYDDILVHSENFSELLYNKISDVNCNNTAPISTLYRVCKYAEKGYYIDKRNLFKLAMLIGKSVSTYRDLINQVSAIGYTHECDFGDQIKKLANIDLDSVPDFDRIINIINELPIQKPRQSQPIPTPDSLTQDRITHYNSISRQSRYVNGIYPVIAGPNHNIEMTDTDMHNLPF